MNGPGLLVAGTLAVLLGGISALLPARLGGTSRQGYRILVGGGCLAIVAGAVTIMVRHAPIAVSFQPGLPGGRWVIGVDGLSAWFLLIIGAIGAVTSWYGV
ncbi:MAG TPA: hypothetical protein VFU03_04430, partial [Gemmatimonadales bacterium]|nr:hypothetical protein [Gemmatimonadales bacterium]